MSTSPLCFDQYVISNVDGDRYLDVGCGLGKWGGLLKKYKMNPSGRDSLIVGVDMFFPHLESLKSQNIYDFLVTADGAVLPFADRSFDSVIACEVLEHMTKDQGRILIEELKRVTKYGFVVTTPNFNCLRDGDVTPDGFNKFEAHQYIYSYKDFRGMGFTQVIGLGRMQLLSWKLGVALSSLGLFFPSRSRYLMGFWFADGKKRVVV